MLPALCLLLSCTRLPLACATLFLSVDMCPHALALRAAFRRYAAVRELTARQSAGGAAAKAAGPLLSLAGTQLQHFRGTRPCGVLHPGQGCMEHAVGFLPGAYLRALPVYFPGGQAVMEDVGQQHAWSAMPADVSVQPGTIGSSGLPALCSRLCLPSCSVRHPCNPGAPQAPAAAPHRAPAVAVSCLHLLDCFLSTKVDPHNMHSWLPRAVPRLPCCCSKMGVGVLRSSLFLSLYVSLAWRGACTGFAVAGRSTGAVIASTCWLAGLAVLVEKKSRRMELALYCLSRVSCTVAGLYCLAGWAAAE